MSNINLAAGIAVSRTRDSQFSGLRCGKCSLLCSSYSAPARYIEADTRGLENS